MVIRHDITTKGRRSMNIVWHKCSVKKIDAGIASAKRLCHMDYWSPWFRHMSIKAGDTETFLRNCIEFNLYKPQRDKTVKGQLLAMTIVDFAEYVFHGCCLFDLWIQWEFKSSKRGFIGRLEEQKGSDILAAAIPEFIGNNVQIIVLGDWEKGNGEAAG
ncbi:hypothetical protein L6452_34019 [Arctium lappa]|uniref:Uncharacterized protein n=1 Tax=Arctium lappa TaxID=4217 RepID=A0ACB8YH76_ARCLA|nr:hypothetical protein L6452_34019 [Arctium lappa]